MTVFSTLAKSKTNKANKQHKKANDLREQANQVNAKADKCDAKANKIDAQAQKLNEWDGAYRENRFSYKHVVGVVATFGIAAVVFMNKDKFDLEGFNADFGNAASGQQVQSAPAASNSNSVPSIYDRPFDPNPKYRIQTSSHSTYEKAKNEVKTGKKAGLYNDDIICRKQNERGKTSFVTVAHLGIDFATSTEASQFRSGKLLNGHEYPKGTFNSQNIDCPKELLKPEQYWYN